MTDLPKTAFEDVIKFIAMPADYPTAAKQMGEVARGTINEHCTEDKIANIWLAFLNELLGNSSR